MDFVILKKFHMLLEKKTSYEKVEILRKILPLLEKIKEKEKKRK